jgi:hypothetical protein
MVLRHPRSFLAVAEELHFARATEKLHMEQSPLSRTIKEQEEDLGEQLFVRTSCSTRLTRAGADSSLGMIPGRVTGVPSGNCTGNSMSRALSCRLLAMSAAS